MRVAIINSDKRCINIILAESVELANTIATELYGDCTVVEDTGSARIGWFYDGATWAEDTTPKPKTDIDILKEENKLLKAQIKAQGDRGDFIEDCIAEMATVVYGGV